MTRAALVYDAGPVAGLGHRRRLHALSTALGALGVEVTLGDARLGASADLVVVDSYDQRADDHRLFGGRLVAAIDDLQRDLAVDVVIDPTPGGSSASHAQAHRVLAGQSYAIVDPELVATPRLPVRDTVDRLLVTTGGADTTGTGARIAERVGALLPTTVSVRLVLGPWGSERVPAGVEAVVGRDGLVEELTAADVVVTAAGVTMLESLALGRPTVAFVAVGNQQRAADGVAGAGAAIVTSVEDAPAAAVALSCDAETRQRLACAGPRYVDGLGAHRVADVLVAALREVSTA